MKESFVFVSCLLLAAGCAHQDSMGGGGSMGSEASAPTTTGSGAGVQTGGSATSGLSEQDAMFLRDAAQSGLAEVQMGQLTAQRTQDPMLKQFGERLVADHTKANAELMRLATAKGMQIPSQISAKDAQMIQGLSGLSGLEFNRMSAQNAIQAHVIAIQKFRLAAQGSLDPDVRAFVQRTLPMLEEHLRMAQLVEGGGTSK